MCERERDSERVREKERGRERETERKRKSERERKGKRERELMLLWSGLLTMKAIPRLDKTEISNISPLLDDNKLKT